MITNIVLKRLNNSVNPPRTEIKVVEVYVPGVERGEGWQLVSSADIVDVVPKTEAAKTTTTKKTRRSTAKTVDDHVEAEHGEDFILTTPGTARLVRKGNKILIAYRRGKETYHKYSPNSVCINDSVKNEFFSDCRTLCGTYPDKYVITHDIFPLTFDKWSNWMDDAYTKALKHFNVIALG